MLSAWTPYYGNYRFRVLAAGFGPGLDFSSVFPLMRCSFVVFAFNGMLFFDRSFFLLVIEGTFFAISPGQCGVKTQRQFVTVMPAAPTVKIAKGA